MMPRLSVWMVRAALIHFGLGFTLGGLILFHKGVPMDMRVWRLWGLHVDLALIGWTMQLAMGVAYWILPRFSQGNRYGRRTSFEWLALILLNLGVILVGIGYAFPDIARLILIGRITEAVAIAAFAIYIWPRVKPLAVS